VPAANSDSILLDDDPSATRNRAGSITSETQCGSDAARRYVSIHATTGASSSASGSRSAAARPDLEDAAKEKLSTKVRAGLSTGAPTRFGTGLGNTGVWVSGAAELEGHQSVKVGSSFTF
jgi:hypothetical protein